ncbi:MAG: substrate-binding domain-containing protein [Armatimonadota bacterium]
MVSRKSIVLIFAAFTALTVSGCSNKPQTSAKGTPENPYVIGMSQCNLGEPWRVQMNADLKAAAAKRPEIKMLFKDAQNDTPTQQSQVREFIAQGVDLLIISPKESRPLTKPVAEAMDAGIPVIVLDRRVEGDKFTTFIGGDNIEIGREVGKHLVKVLNGKGNVVMLRGLSTTSGGIERTDGFYEGIKGSNLKVIFDADCKWLEPNAQAEMKSALSRYPQIDAVYGQNDPMAHGAYLAAKQEGKGREKTIKFVGVDGLPHEGASYVKQGILSATFVYQTGGEEAIVNALKILKNETVAKEQILKTKAITK